MSTQQVLGVVGGVVGAFFGYPQLGFVVGSLVGGLLTPAEKTQGPRVDDLKVQVSTYGAGIPILYGTQRVGGNVVWSTDKIETETTTGGKGGAPENTSYRYFVHMGVVLCETPRDGSEIAIVQIFQDGKLIYDARSGIPVGSALASAENPHAFFSLYQGHADQLPDAIEELYLGGPGTAPAYRGVVRIRMNAIECPGGRVPQFSFVISNSYQLLDTIYRGELATVPTGAQTTVSRMAPDGITTIFFVEYLEGPLSHETKRVRVYQVSLDGAVLLNEFNMGEEYWGRYVAADGDADIDALCVRKVSSVGDNIDSRINAVISQDGKIIKEFYLGPDALLYGQGGTWSKRGDFFLAGCDNLTPDRVVLYSWTTSAFIAATDIAHQKKVVLTDSIAWVLVEGASPLTLQARALDSTLTFISSASLPLSTAGLDIRMTGNQGDSLVIWANDSNGQNAYVFNVSAVGGSIVIKLANTAYEVDGSIPHPLQQTIGAAPNSVYGWERVSVGAETTLRAFMIAFNRYVLSDYKASDIIADQCERAGETRFDVSGIPNADTLHGFTLQNPASARANIVPLLTAFSAFMVDEDGVIKFKKYQDIAPSASISYDELGQAEDGSDATDAMPLSRAQEVDLPRSVSVSYIEPLKDYQTATEKEVRQITEANEDMVVELPIATTSDHAKRVAQTILFDRWRAQNTRSLKVSRKYAFLSPGDGMNVEYPRGIQRLWRAMSITDTGAMIEINVEPGDAELYAQTSLGATGYVSQEVAPLAPPTRMVIGDWPLLRDSDNNPGIYTAFSPLGSAGWRGATLYVGDDPESLVERGSVFGAAPAGIAESVLGDWNLNIVDQSNTLIVNAPDGAFSSITYESMIADLALNACAIGAPGRWEIVQFATASYVAPNQWLISDFKRAQRGTERNTSKHQRGDIFQVLAPIGMLRPNMDVGALNQSKKYKAVTLGRSPTSGSLQTYANTGEGLRPLSPVNLLHEVSGDDIVFTWNRRTRLSNSWMSGVVPLGESVEAYRLTIFSSASFSTVKRVIATASTAAIYSAAQMASDGYVPGQPLYVQIQQISDTVGAGNALQEIL